MPKSNTADQPMVPLGRDTEHIQSHDSDDTIAARQSAPPSSARWLQNCKIHQEQGPNMYPCTQPPQPKKKHKKKQLTMGAKSELLSNPSKFTSKWVTINLPASGPLVARDCMLINLSVRCNMMNVKSI